MEWIKAKILTTEIGAEIVTGILLENNISGMEIINPRERVRHLNETSAHWDYADEKLFDVSNEETHVIFYVTRDSEGEKILGTIEKILAQQKNFFDGIGSFELKKESADDNDWLHEWKKHFKPFSVGKIKIVPEWENFSHSHDNEIIFRIDPGTAFGTGQHETTQLCILALQKFLRDGDSMLDIGCGSGILSIIGLLLGANNVVACDIDPAGAIAATKKNAALNKIDASRLKIFAGDAVSDEKLRAKINAQGAPPTTPTKDSENFVSSLCDVPCEKNFVHVATSSPHDSRCAKKYRIIVANIVADVIIALLPLVEENLADDGIFIASGIIDERAHEVFSAYEKFELVEKFQLEGWVGVAWKK